MRNNLKNNSFSISIVSTPDIEINLICLIYTVNLRIKKVYFLQLAGMLRSSVFVQLIYYLRCQNYTITMFMID